MLYTQYLHTRLVLSRGLLFLTLPWVSIKWIKDHVVITSYVEIGYIIVDAR